MNLREELDAWQSLVAHPKWKELEELAEEQQKTRLVSLINGIDNLREEDKMRGEYLGIGLPMAIPKTMIESLQVEVDNLKEE